MEREPGPPTGVTWELKEDWNSKEGWSATSASVKGPGDSWEAGGVPGQSSFYGVCGHGTVAGVKSERKVRSGDRDSSEGSRVRRALSLHALHT